MTLGPQFNQLQLFNPGLPTSPASPAEESTEDVGSNSQFEQLKMFMTPSEVKDYITSSGDLHYARTPGGGLRNETMAELWERKLESSKAPRDTGHGSGVYEGLEEGKDIMYMRGGNTVEVNYAKGHRFLGDMHHRIAAMADIDQKRGTQTYLPVTHWDSRFVQARNPGAKAKTSEPLGKWQIEEIPFDEAV